MISELFLITAYAIGCDVAASHPTKAGTAPVVGFTVAADPRVLPIGSIIHIEGLGERMVHDVGSGVKGQHVDLYVQDCSHARAWGKRYRRVQVKHRPRR